MSRIYLPHLRYIIQFIPTLCQESNYPAPARSVQTHLKIMIIVISGSGEIRCERIKCDALSVVISGSGGCQIDGKAKLQDVVISGFGDCRRIMLRSNETKVVISGSGDAVLSVRDQLNVTIAGSGTVKYYGTPVLNENSTGSGKTVSLGKNIR